MAGISTTSSVSNTLAASFYVRDLIQATFARREALQVQTNPTSAELLSNDARRRLESRQAIADGLAAAQLNNVTDLTNISSTLGSIETDLGSILALINDTIATPGNAAANQAAIDLLVTGINTQIKDLRNTVPSPTFRVSGLSANTINLTLNDVNTDTFIPDGFEIEVDVTRALTRAQYDDYVVDLDASDGILTFNLTGVDGTAVGIDLSATRAEFTPLTAADIAAFRTLNTGDIVLDVTGTGGTETFTIDGGTSGSVAGAITAASFAAYSAANTGDATVQITGVRGTQSIAIDGGTSASVTAILGVDFDAWRNENTVGSLDLRYIGHLGQADTIFTSTRAETGALITAAGVGGPVSTFDLDVNGTTESLSFTSGDSQADILIDLNAQIAGNGLNGLVEAIAVGGNVGFRTINYGSGQSITLTETFDPNNKITNGSDTGSADTLATVETIINLFSAGTGVRATITGGDLVLDSHDGTDSLQGSAVSVQLIDLFGDADGVIDDNTQHFGTASTDSIASIIGLINGQQAATGVTATNNGGDIDISADDGTTILQGTSADVQIQVTAGDTSVVADDSVGGGTAGFAIAGIVTDFNTTQDFDATTNVEAVNNGGNLLFRSYDRGLAAESTVAVVADPDSLVSAGSDFGERIDQAAAIAIINAQSGTTGVEAIAGSDADNVTLRSFQYGDDIFITTVVTANDANNTLNADATENGTDGQATLTLNGSSSIVVDADRGDFTFDLYGATGSFSIPVDTTYTDTIAIDGERVGNLLDIFSSSGDILARRFNLNTVDLGYLGEDLTITSFGVVNRSRGLADIDVTTDTAAALTIYNRALEQLSADIALVDELSTFTATERATLTGQSALIDDQYTDIDDLQTALNSTTLADAAARQESAETLISQLSALFPTSSLLGV